MLQTEVLLLSADYQGLACYNDSCVKVHSAVMHCKRPAAQATKRDFTEQRSTCLIFDTRSTSLLTVPLYVLRFVSSLRDT